MAQILSGRINLSKIPADMIRYDNNGQAFLWIDVVETLEPGQYGDTHYVSIYDKETKQKIYLGNLRPRELNSGTATDPARPSAFPARAAAPETPAPQVEPVPRGPAPNPRTYPAPTAQPETLEPQADDLPF